MEILYWGLSFRSSGSITIVRKTPSQILGSETAGSDHSYRNLLVEGFVEKRSPELFNFENSASENYLDESTQKVPLGISFRTFVWGRSLATIRLFHVAPVWCLWASLAAKWAPNGTPKTIPGLNHNQIVVFILFAFGTLSRGTPQICCP